MATILVVDDRPDNRAFLVTLLGYKGHRLIEAADGAEGMAAARSDRPDLVIADVLMPTMDGYELVRQMRADPDLAGIPVIFYTAHYREREAQALAESCGVSRVLTKPTEPEEVLRAVGEVLGLVAPAPAPPPEDFDRDHLRLLTDKLSATANELRAANLRQTALIDIGLRLASERDARRLLEGFCQAARDLIGARYAAVGVVGEGEGRPREIFTSGLDPEAAAEMGRPAAREGPLGEALSGRRPVRVGGGEVPVFPARLGVRALLIAPVVSPERVYGWVCLGDKLGAETFTEEDPRLLGILAAQVGRVYENGSLYAEARLRAEELERSTRALRESEARYRFLFERNLAAVLLTRDDGTILDANAAAARLFGLASAEDLTARRMQDFYFDQGERDTLAGRLKRERNLTAHELRFRRADGQEVWTLANVSVLEEGPDGPAFHSTMFDITDRRRAEGELRQREGQLRALGDNLPGGAVYQAVVSDGGRAITYVSAGIEGLLGIPREEALAAPATIYALVLPEDLPRLLETERRAMEARVPFDCEFRSSTRSGEVKWLHARSAPRHPSGGQDVWDGIVLDITERKRAEAALAERVCLVSFVADVSVALTGDGSLAEMLGRCAEMLVRHLDAAFARIWTLDEDGVILRLQASAGLYTHTDGPHSRVPVGRLEIGMIAQEHRPHLTNDVANDPRVGDHEWARREGLVAFAGYPLVVGGRLTGVVAMFAKHALTDATLQALSAVAGQIALGIERKRTEEALRLRDRAVQATSEGILITDPSRHDNPVVFANPGFEHVTGYAASEALGRNCRFLQGRDTDLHDVARLREAVRSATPCVVELLNYRKDGSAFWNKLSVSPVRDDEGRLTHFVGVLTDTTEQHKLEDQLRQAQKMEAVGQLAGGVAHDFNNLLTVINGYSELMLTVMPKDHPLRDTIKTIGEAGDRAASLTRQLLAFSRQTVLEPKVLDLNEVIRETGKMLTRLIGEDVKLALSLREGISRVRVDPGHLGQVLINLAVNARDAMPRGGNLTIETGEAVLDDEYLRTHPETRPGPHVLMAVSDTGSGMSPEVRARIFEPFFTTKGVGKGTGLGLAVVHGVIKQSGGSISVYSEEGIGTTFKIYLPASDGPAEDARPSGIMSFRGTESILLVEDEEVVRRLAVAALEAFGYSVLAAANGMDALRLVAERRPGIDILVTDVVMPNMGGRDLAEALKRLYPTTRVLYTSGYTDDAIVRHGVLHADVAFLQKPYTPMSLARKVREVMDRAAR